jgi:hypothetical protein
VARGRCSPRRSGHVHRRETAGYGSKRLHKGNRDNVGKGRPPAGSDDNLQRPGSRRDNRGARRRAVWRMSPYERRRRGNALRGVPRGRPDEAVRQRGSGHSAVPMSCVQPDTELGQLQRRSRGEGASKPGRERSGRESPHELRDGPGRPLPINVVRAEVKTGLGKSDRPGLQGGLRKRGRWWKWEPTPRTERAGLVTLYLKVHAPQLYPDICTSGSVGGRGGQRPRSTRRVPSMGVTRR